MTTFEELCREWLVQARARALPLTPELVGSHWSPETQVDVVAINWRDQASLLGECKWGADPVERAVIRELVDKTSQVTPATEWQSHNAWFARGGFTEAARREAAALGGTLVDLERLDADLRQALLRPA